MPEPTTRAGRGARSAAELITTSFAGLLHTIRELRRYRNALLLLVAFVIYADGIGTIQRLATSYGAELGIDQGALITAILLVQFAGIPFAFLFGMLAGRIGAKASIFIGLAVYVVLTIGAYNMKTERDFYILALMVATVQGGTQALSRSLFASMIPKARSSEFFGFFSIFEKFGAILGPAVFEMASRTHRIEPQRDSERGRVLHRRRGGAVVRQCPRGSRARRIEETNYTVKRKEDTWQRPQHHRVVSLRRG